MTMSRQGTICEEVTALFSPEADSCSKKELMPARKEGRFLRKAIVLAVILLFCLTIVALYVPKAFAATARVTVVQSRDRYPAGGTYPLLFQIKISDHWYIHEAGKGGGDLIPSALRFNPIPGAEIVDIRFPAPRKKQFSFSTETINVYAGTFLVRATLKVDRGAPTGRKKMAGSLFYQACSETSCLSPETVPISFPVAIAGKGTQTTAINQALFVRAGSQESSQFTPAGVKPGAGLLLTLLGIFLGGMALNLTPCVYPLIPITSGNNNCSS